MRVPAPDEGDIRHRLCASRCAGEIDPAWGAAWARANLFDRYGRVVRDVTRHHEQDVELQVTGREVQIDRDVIEVLAEPLDRIVRFAARCVESKDERRDAGTLLLARIALSAEAEEGRILIRLHVDGRLPLREEILPSATPGGRFRGDRPETLDDDGVMMLVAPDNFPGRDLAGVAKLLEASRSRLRIRRQAKGSSAS